MRLRQCEDGVIVVEPDDCPEEIEIALDDAEAIPDALGWRIVDQYGKVMGGNQ